MKVTTDKTQKAWRAPVKAGQSRPMVRATVERSVMREYAYNSDDSPGGNYDHERSRRGTFASVVLGGTADIVEIPNIRSMTWSRSTDNDVAECTIVVSNTTITPLGDLTASPDWDNPGALSEREDGSEVLWPHIDSSWRGRIQPDRLIRTYEGYGVDWEVWPGQDPNLYLSGTWLIDEVNPNANGDLTIKCRDVGRVLLDQIVFPPAVPTFEYPVSWSTIRTDHVDGRAPTGGQWKVPAGGKATSSNNAYIGAGIVDYPTYVGPNGSVLGHTAQSAMSSGSNTYWLSTGQQDPTDKVWWETEFASPRDISAIRVRCVGGPYKIYVSVWDGSQWRGKKRIPYTVTTAGIDIDAGILFIGSFSTSRHTTYDYVFPHIAKNITKVRLTFTDLRSSPSWGTKTADDTTVNHTPYIYRAALDAFGVYQGKAANMGFDSSGTILRPVGNIADYSDIITWTLAWGGFFWPSNPNGSFIRVSPYGDPIQFSYVDDSPALPTGRVWGSIQGTGTAPIADLTADQFDKQPMFDMISAVRDVTGFIGFWNEAGAYIWRMPNIYKAGNYGLHAAFTHGDLHRVQQFITVDERTTLLDYEVRTSSANLRDRIGVTDTQGKYGAVIQGYRPPNYGGTNLRRVALWSDGHFDSNQEARVAADLIAARQMLDYRRGHLTIWGNPAIQLDDQIKIVERTTGEVYFHYVNGIDCTIDLEAGTFEYNLETCWLGKEPDDGEWVVDTTKLGAATQSYLNLLGTAA